MTKPKAKTLPVSITFRTTREHADYLSEVAAQRGWRSRSEAARRLSDRHASRKPAPVAMSREDVERLAASREDLASALREMANQIRPIGVNFNQVVKDARANGGARFAADDGKALDRVYELWGKLDATEKLIAEAQKALGRDER